jgi:predicted ester cyclase
MSGATLAILQHMTEIANCDDWSTRLDDIFAGPLLEDFRNGHAQFRAAFSGYHLTVDDIVATADKAALRFTIDATHTGEYLGASPTGKHVTASGIGIFHIENRKIVRYWEQFDSLGLLQQIGVIPSVEGSF